MILLLPRTGQATAGDFPILPSPISRLNPPARDLAGFWAGLPGSVGGSRLIDWTDPGPNGNHGTLTNMDPATDWVPSPYGWALDFDGGNDQVQIPSNLPHINPVSGDPLSIAMFVKVRSWFNWACLIERPSVGGLSGWALRLDNVDNISFQWHDSSGANDKGIYSGHISIDDGKWHLICGTTSDVFDNSAYTLYVDGIAQTGTAIISNWSAGSVTTIGNRANAGGDLPLNGFLADVLVFNRNLNPTEIQDLYTNPHALLQPRSRIFALPSVGSPTMSRWLNVPGMHNYLRSAG